MDRIPGRFFQTKPFLSVDTVVEESARNVVVRARIGGNLNPHV